MSWEDATAFCQWLTRKEHDAGRLPAGWSYRLPSDHEWSCAIDIAEREKAKATSVPEEKNEKLPGVYPWGGKMPPPARFGNYAGSETKKFGFPAIESYTDSDAFTAAVDSPNYDADSNGLRHLSGNVWEWCDDWFDSKRTFRVLRGGSWRNNDPRHCLASYRIASPHHHPWTHIS